jgi:hypothetical protein
MGLGFSKANLNIEIEGDKFIKIPYERHNKKYFMLLPLDNNEDIRKKIISLINNTDDMEDDIHINSIIECKIKIKGKREVDITSYLESYMGPDQFYKKNKKEIRIIDILPIKYHIDFSYVKILDEDMEYKTYSNLNDLLFQEVED